MIKLTRGALTMLLAQYRGILKNAWIKNFAVAAALAATVTTAYADPAEVTTWDDAVKEGAVALDGTAGVLNLQESGEIKGAQQITITGGDSHKIGGADQADNIVIKAEDEASYANLTINGKDSEAALIIANKTEGDAKTTGIWLNKVQVGVEGDNKATLTVKTQPAWFKGGFQGEESNQADFTDIDTLEIGGKGAVAVDGGKLDVNEKLTIAKDGTLTNNKILWMGRDDETGNATEVKVDGILTSTDQLYLDSNKLTVGDGGHVNVAGTLGLDNTNEVNINKELTDRKITLTGATSVHASKLVLDANNEKITSVVAGDLTLGSDKRANGDLVAEATVTKNLTALASKTEDDKTVPDTYKIGASESIILDADYKHPCLDLDNESRKGAVASDLDVAGTLTVKSGEWTAKNITVSAGALNVNGKSLAADGLTVKDGTATVAKNAALALKSLEIANGQTLTVAAGDAGQNNAGVLDLTNTKLVNATGEGASAAQGIIANAGVVKITGEKLQGAIANVSDAEHAENNNYGYIFNNTGVIQVSGPTTLATKAFLDSVGTAPGIKNAGTLAVDGALTVNGAKNEDSTLENAGTIKAASLQLNGKEGGAKNAADDSKFTLGGADDQFIIDGVVGANTDTLVVAGKVAAQSIGARILNITGQVGADKTNTIGSVKTAVGSINATDSLTTLDGSKVFADSITAGSIDFSGAVTAGKVTSTKGLTVTKGTHTFGDVTDSSEDGIKLTDGGVTVTGALNATKLAQDAGTLTVTKGSLTVTEASVFKATLEGATANIGTLKATGTLDLTNASTATVGSFNGSDAAKDTVKIDEGSTLTITANQTAATDADKAIFKNNANGDAITGDGTLAVNAGALGLKQNADKNDYVTAESGRFAKESVGVLKINGAKDAIGADKINDTNLRLLIKAVSADENNQYAGKLQLVGVTADISGLQKGTTDAKNGSYLQTEVEVFNKLAGDTTLQSVTVDADAGDTAVSGDVGNLVINAGKTEATIGEATLQGSGSSTATNGYYVSALKSDTGDDAKKVVLAGAALKDANSSLTLAGQGKIGAVTAKTAGEGALNVTGNANVVEVDAEGKEVAADIGATGTALAKVNVSGALTANDIFTKALESSGSVVAANIATGSATIDGGSVSAKTFKTLTAGDESTIKAGSVNVGEAVFAGALTMEGGALTATKNTDAGATGKVELKAGANIKAGTIVAEEVEVSGAKLESAGNITAGNLTAKDEATIKAGSVNADVASFEKALTMEGGVVNAKKVSLADTTTIKGNANLIADELTVTGGNKTIQVGTDKAGDIAGSAGFLFAKNFVGAANTKIVVDPEFENNTSLGGAAAFAGTNKLNADIVIGKNAIFAYDENLTVEQLKSLTSKYNLSDAANGIGSLLVVNSAIDLNNHGINVGKDASTTTNDKLVLSKNGALAVGGTALANAKVNANNSQEAAVTAKDGVKYADSAKVLLDGPVKAGAQYQIFAVGNDKKVDNIDPNSDKKLTASSLNGFYTATINEDGKTTKVNANRGVMYQMTEPLYQHMLAVTGNGNTGAGVQFLEKTASEARDGGKDAETVARLGAFGGLYNAAFNVNKSSTDAIAARMTMGNNGVQQVATNNTVGGAVWLSPVYKNVKADTFESDGKESGADVKLTGIALGGDVTTANNIRLGVMFNLGSGDTDGNNLGSSVENDFDYYGFGAYAGYSFGNFAVAADATYAKVDNDLSAVSGTGYGYFKSSVDTNVYSLGLTAKYAFNTDFATITPHLGVRYTSLNADSYDVQSSYGVLATTSYDSAKVVSFPAGVTLTRDIKLNAWKLQPTFDVTLTANTGDTEATYNTYFTGANSKVKLESEFADSFTYGLAAGIEAQHENGLALGLGVTYEGSSNTNSYGVTGNVRYTF